jgi:hypothetical protein
MLWTLLIVFGCSSTDTSKDAALAGESEDEGAPVLVVDFPQPGSFDPYGSGSVTGSVAAGAGSVQAVTINGASFPLGETGRFSADMGWEPGIQILASQVEDSAGESSTDGRAFHAGPVNEPSEWIENAIRMEVDGEILDDDDDIPDDLSGLLELAFEDPTLLDPLIGSPVDMGEAIFIPTAISFGRARVDIVPNDGFLEAVISLDGIAVDFELLGVSWYSWVESAGSASALSVDAAMTATVVSSNGIVRVDVTGVEVALAGMILTMEWLPDFMESTIAEWTETFIEQAIEDTIRTKLATFVEDSLTAFSVGTTFNENLEMDLRLADLEIAQSGIRFEVDARVTALGSIELPPHAGSLKTVGEAPDWPTYKTQPFWAAIDDDIINQLGFAFWQTGLAKDVEMDGVVLGLLSGGALPEPLGPSDSVLMSLNLPPVLTPTESDDWAAQVTIGEWELVFNRNDGEVLRFALNVRTHVNADVAELGAIQIEMDSRPESIEQAIGIRDIPDSVDPKEVVRLLEALIPPLLRNSASFAPDIPIPTLSLDEFVAVEATEGKILRVDQPHIRLEESGWLLLQAGLAVD